MAPVTASPWSSLQWSVCVLAVSSLLLPTVLLVCASCSKRKSKESSGESTQKSSMEMASIPADVTKDVASGQQKADISPDSQAQPAEPQETLKDDVKTPANKSERQLPTLPAQVKERVRRHSSYTSFNVYDVVMDVQNEWQEAGSRACRRQTSDCSNLYEEVQWKDREEGVASFPVYAKVNKVNKVTPTASRDMAKTDGNKDFPAVRKIEKDWPSSEI
ncbi:hypothetical protein MATL_G00125850 [Megalops atlanticus]|uniref:Uncharacterized protein n=1 Tax=Megalops atlanticus TaxID=7932 RepID=A0A9D3PVG4_MEGAT|nr:hypothetical protein MATL_G00125850 [Megalops atlanticus]